MSVLSGTLGAVMQRQSAREAEATNQRNARKDRELTLRMFQESRGSAGSALLPTYGGDFEKNLFTDTRGAYEANRAAMGTPTEELARYQADVDRFRPAFEQGNQFIDSIYSGAMKDERLAEAQPVMDARTALAKTQKQGILDDITARLGALDAANARKGFVGSGTGFQNAQLRSTAPLYQQAAGVGAAATLQNAQQRQGVLESNRELQLNSLGLPVTRAQQATALRQMPGQALSQGQLTAQKPFGMFNIGTAAFKPEPLPQVQALPNNLGIISAGIGAAGGQVGNYLAQQQQAKALQQMYAARVNYNQPAYNPYTGGDAANYDAASIYGLASGNPAAAWGGAYGETAGVGAFDYF